MADANASLTLEQKLDALRAELQEVMLLLEAIAPLQAELHAVLQLLKDIAQGMGVDISKY